MMPIYILLHLLSIDKVIRDGVYFFSLLVTVFFPPITSLTLPLTFQRPHPGFDFTKS